MPADVPISIEDPCWVERAGFFGERLFVVLADGRVRFEEPVPVTITANDGILCSSLTPDNSRLVCGGEDGRLTSIDPSGGLEVLLDIGSRWINVIATGPNGLIAAADGKTVYLVARSQPVRRIECDRTVEGMAFAPKGARLAISRFDGVELRWINTKNPPQFLEWKGAHLDVCFSPNGKNVISTMQENALHGWRLSDGRHMQMTGYPVKVKSLSWSHKGNWLATSGAPAAIVWPFAGKDGPMGKAPLELGSMGKLLTTAVACHPQETVMAVGYENGMIVLIKIEDGQEVPLRERGAGEISSLHWDATGTRLAYGSVEGEAGYIDIRAAAQA